MVPPNDASLDASWRPDQTEEGDESLGGGSSLRDLSEEDDTDLFKPAPGDGLVQDADGTRKSNRCERAS